MDFASLMSSAISAKPPPLSTDSSSKPPPNKYLKRSTLESERQAAYLSEQHSITAAREAKQSRKRELEDEEAARTASRNEKRQRLAEESRSRKEVEEEKRERARRKRLGLPDQPAKGERGGQDSVAAEEKGEDIPPETLLLKLRELGEPAVLFGETHARRLARYRTLTAPKAKRQQLSSGPIPTTLVPLPESELKVPSSLPKDNDARAYLFRQLSSYFSLVLSEWIVALAARPQSVKESSQGRAAENAMLQSRENMRPLFKKFEAGDVPEAILQPIVEIVHAAQERRYVDANDGYLRLSIGKAAWPIGVTMVGIHERSAREKLHESEGGKAHIMSDEVTRKFLQSIKRCLSFAQTRWPPEDIGQLMG